MNDRKNFESHNITIHDRRHSELSGIDDVLSFDDSSISMHSALGDMVMEGEELKIDSFSSEKGILSISGKVIAIYYLESDNRKHSSGKRK